MKKLIALVLFVAMMAMMVPTASAVVAGAKADDAPQDSYIQILDGKDVNKYWYASPTPESLEKSGKVIGKYGLWEGVKVEYELKKTDVKNDTYNITITGAYDDIESMYGGNNWRTYGKYVMIPYVMKNSAGTPLDESEQVLVPGSSENLGIDYDPNNHTVMWIIVKLTPGGGTYAGAIGRSDPNTKVMTEQIFAKINVTYKDQAHKSSDKTYSNVTFEVVKIGGAQKDNFRVSLQNAKTGTGDDYNVKNALESAGKVTANDVYGGDSDWAYTEDGIGAVNTLTFNIAALDKATRKAILTAGAKKTTETISQSNSNNPWLDASFPNSWTGTITSKQKVNYYKFDAALDAMAVQLKVYQADGTVYPAGTVVQLVKPANLATSSTTDEVLWSTLIGSSNKTVATNGATVYYLDANSSFVLTVPGISVFAASAAGLNSAVNAPQLGSSAVYSLYQMMKWYYGMFNGYTDGTTNTDGKTIYGLTEEQLETVVNWTAGNNNFGWAYKWYIGRLGLQFTYGQKSTQAALDIYFQNVEQTKSGITTLGEDYTIELGTTAYIPYIWNNADAMNKTLKTAWASVNSNILSVSGDQVTAKKVGTTYLYCTDIDGTVHILNVTVVDPNAVTNVTTPEITNQYTSYVVTASKLNVRSGEGTTYAKIGTYNRNTVVYGVENPATGWVAIYANGQLVGYCSGAYLAEIE